jgi:hypothetical protein
MRGLKLMALGVGKPEQVSRRRAIGLVGGTAGLLTGAGWHQLEAKKKVSPFKNIPVTANEDGGDRTFEGLLTIKKFDVDRDENNAPVGLVAVGKVKGVVKDAQGEVQQKVKENVRLPVTELDGAPPVANPNSATSDRVQATETTTTTYVIAFFVVIVIALGIYFADYEFEYPLSGCEKETDIVNEINRHRDHPGGALPGLAFWLNQWIRPVC